MGLEDFDTEEKILSAGEVVEHLGRCSRHTSFSIHAVRLTPGEGHGVHKSLATFQEVLSFLEEIHRNAGDSLGKYVSISNKAIGERVRRFEITCNSSGDAAMEYSIEYHEPI